MVCLPKKYTSNVVGGYLLNNEKYYEEIFIDKRAYAFSSVLTNNTIYDMVNNISSTPFKVNIELFHFLNTRGVELGLIMDTSIEHEFQHLSVLKPYQRKRLASYRSKILLQETILGIVDVCRYYKYRTN
jgi:hypothetical protein